MEFSRSDRKVFAFPYSEAGFRCGRASNCGLIRFWVWTEQDLPLAVNIFACLVIRSRSMRVKGG
jgi:hypothetical protein